MTAKQKASQLVQKFREIQPPIFKTFGIDAEYEHAKESALICVDEIVKILDKTTEDSLCDFYQEVKIEINKL